MSNHSEIETFLRRFRPRPPAPLPTPAQSGARRWSFLALAAAMVAAFALVAWRFTVAPQPGPQPAAAAQRLQPTLGALNAALRAGNLDSVLDDMGQQTLPDPCRPGGALEVLARDSALPGRPEGGFK